MIDPAIKYKCHKLETPVDKIIKPLRDMLLPEN